jgi:UPF0755 protein
MSDFEDIKHVPFWKLRPRMPHDRTAKHYALFGLVLFLVALFYVVFIKPPTDFERETYFSIEEGSSLMQISENLKEQNLIRSRFSFQAFMVILGRDTGALAGDYYFEEPISSIRIANRFAEGLFELDRISVFLQEGFTVDQYAFVLEDRLPRFNDENFLRLIEGKEGYLFPDSYFFFETADEHDVIKTLEDTFAQKTEALRAEADANAIDFDDIVIMASLIQREANNISSEMKMISGILWNRIEKGMRLQVDATFKYYLDKASSQVTKADLAEDHPYNTYVNKGLPPGPIGNPGLKALDAALHPTDNNYVFYLHDRSGGIHYAVTHDQHVNNKNSYLR